MFPGRRGPQKLGGGGRHLLDQVKSTLVAAVEELVFSLDVGSDHGIHCIAERIF